MPGGLIRITARKTPSRFPGQPRTYQITGRVTLTPEQLSAGLDAFITDPGQELEGVPLRGKHTPDSLGDTARRGDVEAVTPEFDLTPGVFPGLTRWPGRVMRKYRHPSEHFRV